jgi:superfamily II RNA helicase
MFAPLTERLPGVGRATDDEVLDYFLGWVKSRGLELYPAQEEALLEIFAGRNVILNTPTGSGKSLVATALHFKSMAEGRRSFYTSPIKALVNEKFFDLCREFGPGEVGMLTGDASVNHDAPIICCTAEVLANIALRQGAGAPVDYAILDEFHYYADKDRGTAWQVPLLTLPKTTFLLMSATLGPTERFERALVELTGREAVTVRSIDRPVPLEFEYRETPLHETVKDLMGRSLSPIYIVCFTQRACAEEAQNLMSVDYATKEEKRAIHAALEGVKFDSPYGKEVARFVRHGIGLHHAGLLPKYRLIVEKLAQRGLVKVICGTDTLGVGVNIPIRTVLFTKLCKFDGEKTAILSVRDFQQISGRAGRKGFDVRGAVVVQAPEHVIENRRLEQKAGADPVKKKRIVRKKPPDKGYVHWDRTTFDRLVTSPPEPLVSRFQVSHGMLLEVLGRPTGGCRAMKQLVRSCHDGPTTKRQHRRTAMAMLRSLVEAGIVQLTPRTSDTPSGIRINVDLQEEFSMHHALSLYVIDTIPALEKGENPDYALDLLTLVESILENPQLILAKQLDRLKGLTIAELKAAGVEYDDRMAELEKLDYPKPNSEFIYATFNDFAKRHPWVGQDNIRPKSVAREMYETWQSFAEYIKEYGLERAEGLLLRYLSDAYKALLQTVPERDRDDQVEEMLVYLRGVVRGVDSSLLDEWERMRNPEAALAAEVAAAAAVATAAADAAAAADATRDLRRFTVLVRNEVFRLLRALAKRDWAAAAEMCNGSDPAWTPEALEAAMVPYFTEHGVLRTDPEARIPERTVIRRGEATWEVAQVLVDAEGPTPWALDCVVDLHRSRQAGAPVLALRAIG